MSSPVASTFTSKVSKNPGLTIDLKADTTAKSHPNSPSFTRTLPSAVSSLSNTPALEPDCLNEDDASDYGDNEESQYIYILSESPFYHPPTTPRTFYLSVSGFPFACDALAEEDPLFAGSAFDDEVDSDSGDNDIVVIVDTDLTEDVDSRSKIEWKFTETLDPVKPTRTEIDNESSLRPIF